ncbi:MAG TPA: hypothetical protein DET40_15425 [Lentisphaeria bacterium]|nr:MAG: hypothetical protein A2X45_05395 [Lentisphaerae bacterium GWF2_50_93]HCE44929.1 hypothetical protein [Lentisphaeria bacterium]
MLMKNSSFPGLDEHVSMHEYFRENIERMAGNLHAINDVSKVAEELKVFLSGWLEDHILSTDMKMAGFLKEKDSAGGSGGSL